MLRGYLDAWFPIIASRWASTGATYVDAFAGPGEYTDGSDGSPVIALRVANRADVTEYPTKLRMVFIEKHAGRLRHLDQLIDRRGLRRGHTEIITLNDACETALLPVLDRVGAWPGPMFVNLDGWGVDTPYAVIERIGTCTSAEVLITFEAQWFTRFATIEDTDAGDRVFGDRSWRAVTQQPTPEKTRFLVDRYLDRLREAGFPFTLIFELVDEGAHSLFLVFGTKNKLGLIKMKDAMWGIDPVWGQQFRDPRDVNQLSFDIAADPNLALLDRQILLRLDDGPMSLAALKDFALLETVFKETHAVSAVTVLQAQGKVERTQARAHADVMVSLKAQRSIFE